MIPTIELEIHFERQGRGSHQRLEVGPDPCVPTVTGRVPRVAKLMALAIRWAGLLRDGHVENYAEIARLGQVTRARVTQIMNLLNLSPDIQEALLFLPRVHTGKDPLILADLQPIAGTIDWRKQRKMWTDLLATNLEGPAVGRVE